MIPNRVVLVGMSQPYIPRFGKSEEIWGCNFSYTHQHNLDRIYFVHHIEEMKAVGKSKGRDFVKDINGLGARKIAQENYSEIYGCEAFDFNGVYEYMTSTIAYMFADAIREGFDDIHLHKILCSVDAHFYEQKSCLDWWAGYAKGKGINVTVSKDSYIGRPGPHQSGRYGFDVPQDLKSYNDQLDAFVKSSGRPQKFVNAETKYAGECNNVSC